MIKFATLLVALMVSMASAQMRGTLANRQPAQAPTQLQTKDMDPQQMVSPEMWNRFQLSEHQAMEKEVMLFERQLSHQRGEGEGRELQVTIPPVTPVPTLPPANFKVSGTYGERRRCFDKRFTMVCSWEAEKKRKKKYYGKSHRRLGGLDFDDEEEEEEWEEVQQKEITTPDGRRLKVELDNVECVLGVGKKDSDDSDDEYMEYKERIGFPNDRWTIKIGEQMDTGVASIFRSYSFDTRVTFEDIMDPNNSGDEITISGNLVIRMACFYDPTTGEDQSLFFRSHDVRIIC